MTDHDKHILNERIARLGEQAGLAGDLLWQAAEACPQGHSNREPECGELDLHIGDICFECRDEADVSWKEHQEHWDDLTWHPEWRIGKAPRDFTDPAVLWPVWETYIEHPHANQEWNWYRVDEGWFIEMIDFVRDEERQWKGVGATITESVAQILHQMLEDAAGGDLQKGEAKS